MISLIVATAICLGITVMYQRSAEYRTRSIDFEYSHMENLRSSEVYKLGILFSRQRGENQGDTQRYARDIEFWEKAVKYDHDRAQLFDSLAKKYRHASSHPWEYVPPDPLIPERKVMPPPDLPIPPEIMDQFWSEKAK
jgi:hypothetical protein